MKIKSLIDNSIHEIHTAKQSGEEAMTCPVCSHTRKKKSDKCMSWSHAKQVGHCAHCDANFVIDAPLDSFKYVSRENREYKRPEWKNNTDLSEKAVKWFDTRGITQFVLREMKIGEGLEWMPQTKKEMNTIQFNYFRDGQLINTKFRTGNKLFKMVSGAEKILYNIDNCIGKEQIVIVEGEMDVLSCITAGIRNVVSVPNGATLGNINFDYLDACIDVFESAKEIIIATDNDTAGINLREQLAHRLGVERCYKVDFSPYKDSNDVLCHEGIESLKKRIVCDKIAYPIDGVFSSNDFREELDLLYSGGLKPGKHVGIPEIDELISFEPGRLYTWTGIPGHGKSEMLDFILELLNIKHGSKVAYFSPENHPLQLHASKIIEKLTGRKFSKSTLPIELYQAAKEYIKDNFYFINPKDDYKIETILEKARYCVLKYGISHLVIDPYNKLEHQFSGSETQYISSFLDKLINFGKKNNVSIHLVAHPRKMNKDKQSNQYEVPTLYDINGSSNFFNKTDFGISVYRDMSTGDTMFYVQKVKFKHLGKIGMAAMRWNVNNGRYAAISDSMSQPDWDNNTHLTYSAKNAVTDLFDFEIDSYNNKEIFNNLTSINETPF